MLGAIGAEYRRAEIDDTPSIDSQNGNLYNLTSAAIRRGSDSVAEIYGEAELPLLRGLPGAEELTVNISGRYTDYKSYGGDTTYKIGALYTPVRALTFRAAQGTSYRAPALFEQYVGATTGFLNQQGDPCYNYGALDPTSARERNCASEGRLLLGIATRRKGDLAHHAGLGSASCAKAIVYTPRATTSGANARTSFMEYLDFFGPTEGAANVRC